MSEVTAPIMTDATGQSIDSKLNSLLTKMDNLANAFQPNASGIVYSNSTSGLTGDDVQEAIDEMAADVSEIKQSLTNLVKTNTVSVTFANNPYATPFTSAALISCQNDLGIDRSRVISVIPHTAFSVLWYFYSNDTDTIVLAGSTTQTVSVDVLYI